MIEEDTEGQILVSIHVHTYNHLHITYKHTPRERETEIQHTLCAEWDRQTNTH